MSFFGGDADPFLQGTAADNDAFLTHRNRNERRQTPAPAPPPAAGDGWANGLQKNMAWMERDLQNEQPNFLRGRPVPWYSALGMPAPMFLLISSTFGFFLQIFPALPLLLLLAFAGSILYTFAGRRLASAPESARFLSCVLAAVLAPLCGYYAHEAQIGTFYDLAFGNEYRDVFASSNADAYADAGTIHFASSSMVDADRSLGYRHDGRDYCVAPILDRGVEQVRDIGFWAVGLDCCERRGGFDCPLGEWGSASARASGVRVQVKGLFVDLDTHYRAAVEQAGKVYDVVPVDRPVLVRVVKDPTAEHRLALLLGIATILVGTLLFAALMVLLSLIVAALR